MPRLLNPDWKVIPVDAAEWESKGGRLLGLDQSKCSVCGSLTRSRICMNACHLAETTRDRFYRDMSTLMDQAKETDHGDNG